jgi:hypothetical protein
MESQRGSTHVRPGWASERVPNSAFLRVALPMVLRGPCRREPADHVSPGISRKGPTHSQISSWLCNLFPAVCGTGARKRAAPGLSGAASGPCGTDWAIRGPLEPQRRTVGPFRVPGPDREFRRVLTEFRTIACPSAFRCGRRPLLLCLCFSFSSGSPTQLPEWGRSPGAGGTLQSCAWTQRRKLMAPHSDGVTAIVYPDQAVTKPGRSHDPVIVHADRQPSGTESG